MFHKLRELRKFQTSKVTFKDIQGHWQWCHSIGHIWFPISVRLQLCLDLAPLTRYYYLFPKFKEVMWDIHIPFKGNIWCVHNTRNLKCLASPIPKNWDKILKKRVTWPWPRPLWSSLSSKAKHLIYSTCTKNWLLLLQSFWRYDCERQIEKWVMWHWPHPFRSGLSSLGWDMI